MLWGWALPEAALSSFFSPPRETEKFTFFYLKKDEHHGYVREGWKSESNWGESSPSEDCLKSSPKAASVAGSCLKSAAVETFIQRKYKELFIWMSTKHLFSAVASSLWQEPPSHAATDTGSWGSELISWALHSPAKRRFLAVHQNMWLTSSEGCSRSSEQVLGSFQVDLFQGLGRNREIGSTCKMFPL